VKVSRAVLYALVLGLSLAGSPVLAECDGACQDGYKSLCGSRRGQGCRCTCLKELSSAPEKLRKLLRELGVSVASQQKTISLYGEFASRASGKFCFEITDKGEVILIEGVGFKPDG
jgi:hypothetical protein